MKRTQTLLIILIFALIQAEILDFFRLFLIKPDLLLIVAVFIIFNRKGFWPFIFVLFCALMKDSLSYAPFGLNTFIFCSIAILVRVISKGIYFEQDQDIGFLFFIVFGSLFNSVINYIYLFHQISFPAFLKASFLSAIYTVIVAVFLFRSLRRFILVWT